MDSKKEHPQNVIDNNSRQQIRDLLMQISDKISRKLSEDALRLVPELSVLVKHLGLVTTEDVFLRSYMINKTLTQRGCPNCFQFGKEICRCCYGRIKVFTTDMTLKEWVRQLILGGVFDPDIVYERILKCRPIPAPEDQKSPPLENIFEEIRSTIVNSQGEFDFDTLQTLKNLADAAQYLLETLGCDTTRMVCVVDYGDGRHQKCINCFCDDEGDCGRHWTDYRSNMTVSEYIMGRVFDGLFEVSDLWFIHPPLRPEDKEKEEDRP